MASGHHFLAAGSTGSFSTFCALVFSSLKWEHPSWCLSQVWLPREHSAIWVPKMLVGREKGGEQAQGMLQRQPGLRRRGLQTEPFSSPDEGCPSLPPPVSETTLPLRASLEGDSGESLGLPHSPQLRTSVSS